MLMAMSKAEKWLSQTKSGIFFFFFLNSRRTPCPEFLKNGRRVFTLDILKNLRLFD